MNYLNQEQVQFLVDKSELILLEVDLNFTVISFNPFFAELFNLSEEHNVKLNLFNNVFSKPIDLSFISSVYDPILTGKKNEIDFSSQVQGQKESVQVEWKVKRVQDPTSKEIVLFHIGKIIINSELNQNAILLLQNEILEKNHSLGLITKQSEILSRIIQQYTPKAIWERAILFMETNELDIPNAVMELTFLFLDIKDFTSFAEKHSPERVILALHDIFSVAMEIIDRNSGDVDKFIGDAIFSVFDNPLNACKAALEIQKAVGEINESRINLKEETLHLRAGINSGKAIRGNVGNSRRKDNTLIGDSVNVASRLEKLCDPDKVLISENTYQLVKNDIKITSGEKVNIRGRESELTVYYIEEA
ncbi:MAG: adenylate/guanylate cyclase domain-containing protein [Leptospiraceae bacterium]|nr:adenylate/guanylate cyclase domain-containing protein [Leptospiraceae bacterium]MCK6381471.1 adenylate/guanylate cyclase domain-containing protein [Leptospiraceae bacterium]NUM40186.1 adenylate/guanylate cyclase domain-containing protein [Leptospiraceae bacterium]